jgi:hypothetical protein
MAKKFAPMGLQVRKHESGNAKVTSFDNAIPAAGVAYNLFAGQPVKLVAGVIAPVTAITDVVLGRFVGIEYVDKATQRPQNHPYYIANTQFSGLLIPETGTVCRVAVMDASDTIFEVQATGPIAGGAIVGQQFNFATVTTVTQSDGTVFPFAGNTVPMVQAGTAPYGGYSYASINPAPVAAGSTGQLIVVEIPIEVGQWADPAFPLVRVKINKAQLKAALVVA